jgi:hypothetical protein
VTAKVRLRRRSIDDFYPLVLAARHEGAALKFGRVVNVNGFGQPSYRPDRGFFPSVTWLCRRQNVGDTSQPKRVTGHSSKYEPGYRAGENIYG